MKTARKSYKRMILALVLVVSITGCMFPPDAGIALTTPDEYEIVRPVNKSKIRARTTFSFKKIKRDWELLNNVVSIDKKRLGKEICYIKSLAKNQYDRTKFSAWGAHPLLHMLLDAYLCTKEEEYLNDFIWLYEYFLSVRMDNKKRINYNGDILPQWERVDRYNIFTVSPYKKYHVAEKEKIIKQRNWRSLFFSDVNYSGLFIEPMLRFVQIINGNRLSKFKAISDAMFLEVEKVILSHEKDWISLTKDTGYYIFPKNCPFYLDGVEMPVNEAAIFGSSLVRAYFISRDDKYKNRALQMWNRWKEYITRDQFGYVSYPYFTGAAYNGWDMDDNISINTPAFKPQNRKNHEVFHKAALTIDFLILLEQSCPNTTAKYLREFHYVMMASLQTKTICSDFPGILGFGYPLNTYHSVLPYVFKGWVHLSSQDEHFSDIASAYMFNKKNQPLKNLLYFQYISERDINDIDFVEYSETVSPHYLEDKKSHCLWKSPISGLVVLKFQHTSPKHNTLYLYDYENDKRKIRLNIKSGAFYSTIFASEGECIDLRWKKSQYGSPSNEQENKIDLIYWKSNKKSFRSCRADGSTSYKKW